MKKLIYSSFMALAASAFLTSCGGDDGGGSTTPTAKGPSIEFQTNTGTFSGYTFADDKIETGTTVKIGVKLTGNDANLKSTKMTVKYNSQAEQLIGTDSTFSGSPKTAYREYTFKLPADKGTYVFTAYATDKNATTTSAKITVTAYGKLQDMGEGTVYSLKATGANKFSAFDLFTATAITAASGAGNESQRDIVDQSTGTTLAKTWTSGNGTQFVISGADGKLNSKVYSQFVSEQDIIDAWNAASTKSTTINNVDEGRLIIAKSTQFGQTVYYLIGISTVSDMTGSEDDYYTFQYKR